MEPEAPPPKLFSDDLLADMQHCLLTLEKRVKEGPGSLNHAEIDSFAMASARVLNDMKSTRVSEQRMKPGERQARAEAAAAAAAVQAEKEGKSPAEIEAIAKAALDAAFSSMIPPPVVAASPAAATSDPKIDSMGRIVTAPKVSPAPAIQGGATTTAPLLTTLTNPKPYDDNESEGPAYDGTGFGVAKGTANTYVIEGMDEMTAEEYQAALSQQVIERARKRRYGLGGAHGNRQTLDYMNSLSGGRDINPMNAPKKDDAEE